jgi:hypothetical protein
MADLVQRDRHGEADDEQHDSDEEGKGGHAITVPPGAYEKAERRRKGGHSSGPR